MKLPGRDTTRAEAEAVSTEIAALQADIERADATIAVRSLPPASLWCLQFCLKCPGPTRIFTESAHSQSMWPPVAAAKAVRRVPALPGRAAGRACGRQGRRGWRGAARAAAASCASTRRQRRCRYAGVAACCMVG